MSWIDEIKPYTKRIYIDHSKKHIMLVHPHFNPGKRSFINLLHSIKQDVKYNGYTVECVGFASIKGMLILKSIERFLNRLNSVRSVSLNANVSTALYDLKVEFN